MSVWRDLARKRAPVVRGVSLRVEPGTLLAVLGPNGAGKTSLLLALAGAAPFSGQVLLQGEALSSGDVEFARRHVGLLFSEPADQLFCATAFEEVAFGPRQRALREDQVRAIVLAALDRVGLSDRADESPAELSLGQQRRLALAAAVACEPSVLLCDEPTAALDPVARLQMLATLESVERAVVLATHDIDAALALDCEALLLRDGAPVAVGRAREILRDLDLLRRAGLAE